MESFITYYNENQNNNLEFEITYHLYKNINSYKNIFNKLKDISENISIIENIDIYYDNNIRLTKQFKNGNNVNKDIIIKKKSILKPLTLKNYIDNVNLIKVKLNEENNAKLIIGSNNIKMIRIKLRLNFILKNNTDYSIDLDLIKNFNIQNNNLKEVKNLVFKPYKLSNIIEDLNFTLFDDIILETEFFNKTLNLDIVNNSISFIQNLLNESSNDNNDYQEYIYNIAKFIISNKNYLDNFY